MDILRDYFPKKNLENNTFNSIEGATALKLDEKFEINEQEQNALIYKFIEKISEPENKICNQEEDTNIPTGVSIESASYMESNNNEILLK